MNRLSDQLITEIANALKQNETLPDLKLDLDLDEAYLAQHRVTKSRSPKGVVGIKAGVTAEPVQKLLGLEHALIASLHHGSQLVSGASILPIEGRLIESEVALKLDGTGKPISIAPALEIVAVRFTAPEQMSAENLVVCNLGADRFVVGDFVPWSPEYNDLTMVLFHDGEAVNETAVSVALGGPESGAAWVYREACRTGFELNEDLVFMMGACGKVVPTKSGHYVGDYGSLGKVELVVG